MGQITVLVVDDDRVTRKLVRETLARDNSILVVGEAEDGRQAVELAHKHQPDVVIMDIEMPVLDGHEATVKILAEHPHTHVVMHSSSTEESEIERAFANGALGYVGKTSTHHLCGAVHAVSRGRMYVCS